MNVIDGNTPQELKDITTDMNGGAFVFLQQWADFGSDSSRLVLQRISSEGERMFGDDGITVAGYTPLREDEREDSENRMVTDGNGGVLLYHGNNVKRYDSEGNLMWVTPCDYKSLQLFISDGNGGCAAAGWYHILDNNTYEIVVNRIDSDGNYVWTQDEIIIADSLTIAPGLADIKIFDDATMVILWTKIIDLPNEYTFHLQIIEPSGEFRFPYEFNPIDLDSLNETGLRIIESNNNSSIFIWKNVEAGGRFSQKLNTDGTVLWDSSHTNITSIYFGGSFEVVTDSRAGFIYVFSDSGIPVYAQQVSCRGYLGEITKCTNIQGDINFDGQLDLNDVILIIEIILNNYSPSNNEIEVGDMNYDGNLDLFDIILIIHEILLN
tara:strand:+ start:143 stop:1282 length:1140 start_codon:yes stop_codon:yes gene_type:complete